jgi:hypothetical protein
MEPIFVELELSATVLMDKSWFNLHVGDLLQGTLFKKRHEGCGDKLDTNNVRGKMFLEINPSNRQIHFT